MCRVRVHTYCFVRYQSVNPKGFKVYTNEAVEVISYETDVLGVEDDLDRRSEVFKALADPNRLKLIYLLMDGEKCVSELLPFFKILQPTVSVHLLLLQDIGLLSVRRDGRKRYYSLADERILLLIDGFCERIWNMKTE
jgi:DNA-binding transcriptional ArsR family regulator